jgi:hypothetical protein
VRACRQGLALTAVRVSRQPGTTNGMGAYVAKAKPSTGASQTDSCHRATLGGGLRARGDHQATVGKQRWIETHRARSRRVPKASWASPLIEGP